MDILALIDETIEEIKSHIEDDEYIYKANSFDLSINTNRFESYKDVPVHAIIRNIILLYCIGVNYDDYKLLNEKLEKMDFNPLYDSFIKHHTPSMMELMEVIVADDKQKVYTTVLGKRSFKLLGISDLYNENLNSNTSQKIISDELDKQDKQNIELLFTKHPLDDLLPKDLKEEDIIDIKNAIYNILMDKYNSFVFDQRRKILFGNPMLKLVEEKTIEKQENDSFLKDDLKFLERACNKLISLDNDYKKQETSIIHALEKAKTYIEDKEHLAENIDKINFTALAEVDEDLYLEVFKLVLEEQEKRYQKALHEEEESKLKEENRKIENILQKYKIAFKTLSDSIKSLLMQSANLDLLDRNMKALDVNNEDHLTEEVFQFLINTPIKQMNHYTHLVNKEYLEKRTLFDYIDSKKDMEVLNRNAQIIFEQNISPETPNYNENILFVATEELTLNSKLLSWYKKPITDNNFNYLYDCSSYDALDILIENDLNLALLDNNKLSLEQIEAFRKRLQISLAVGIDIYTKSGNINRSFLLGKGFYCEEDKLDEYMLYSSLENEDLIRELSQNKRNHINEDIMNLDIFKQLETYKQEDDLTYIIENISISRPKVMRNLTYFYEQNKLNDDTILQSIIYNSNLNDEEIQTIQKQMQPKDKVQKVGGKNVNGK